LYFFRRGSIFNLRGRFLQGNPHIIQGLVFFHLNYHLFKRPQGILCFPDRGQVRTVYEGVYLIASDNEGWAESFSMQNKVTKTRKSNVYISALSEEFFTGIDGNFVLSEKFGMNETIKLVRATGPAVMALPSPLIY